MKKRKVISNKNFRNRFPIISILLTYLILNKWNAPQWIYGAFGLLYLLLIVAFIIDLFRSEDTDIFNNEKGGIK